MSFETQLMELKKGTDFTRVGAECFLSYVLDNESVTDEQIADMLTALTNKTLLADELSGFIDAMRARMVKLKPVSGAIDTCGTGGDKSGTFNISTASAILVSAAGIPVAKHGNRAATSKCGSADVLEALNIPVDLSYDMAGEYLKKNDFVFLFAPLYHPSLKRLAVVRRQLGFPTVFNLLGPLLNPASVKRQVIGTFSFKNAELIAQVVAQMDYEHAIVLASQDGLDEASLSAPVDIFEICGSKVSALTISGTDYSLKHVDRSELIGGDAIKNASITKAVMKPSEQLSSQQEIVVFNAGIALYVSGKTDTIQAGVELAKTTLSSGKGNEKLHLLTKATN